MREVERPTSCRIRDATGADASAIAAIWNPIIRDTVATFWPHPRSPDDLARLISERQAAGWAFLVAEQAGAVAGFASFFQFRAGPGYVHTMEHNIHLAAEVRGRGFGRALMVVLEARAEAAGARSLIGAVTGGNAASLAFHRRIGFVEVARIPDAGWKFGRFHDLVLMQKRLAGPAAAAR